MDDAARPFGKEGFIFRLTYKDAEEDERSVKITTVIAVPTDERGVILADAFERAWRTALTTWLDIGERFYLRKIEYRRTVDIVDTEPVEQVTT